MSYRYNAYSQNGYVLENGYNQQSIGGDGAVVGFGGHATLNTGLMAVWEFNGSVKVPPDPNYYGNPTYGNYTLALIGVGPNWSNDAKNGAGAYNKDTSGTQSFEVYPTTDFNVNVIADVSVACWAKRVSRRVYSFVSWDRNVGTMCYALYGDDQPFFTIWDADNVTISTATGSVGTVGGYNLWVGGYDSSLKKSWVSCNGEAKIYSSTAIVNPRVATADGIMSGQKAQSGTPGVKIDSLMVWSKILSNPEISDLYAAGAGLFY